MDNVDDALAEQAHQAEGIAESERGKELLRAVDFGLQVEAFQRGEIYRRLCEDSDAERSDLMAAIVALDPDDAEKRKAIQRYRQRIGVLEHWQDWFDKYVQDGKVAEAEFYERDG